MGVVEHFEDGPLPALGEAYRVLKPNGLIFVSVPTVNVIRRVIRRPLRSTVNALPLAAKDLWSGWRKSKRGAVRAAVGSLLPEAVIRMLLWRTPRYRHFAEYRYTRDELEGSLQEAGFEMLETVPHDFHGSRDHSAGLAVDFPFLRACGGGQLQVECYREVGVAAVRHRISLDRLFKCSLCR